MKQKQSSGARFWKGYVVFTAVLLIIVAAGLGVFYDFIRAYELSQPEHAAEEFVRSFDSDQLAEWIWEEVSSLPLTYESADAAARVTSASMSLAETIGPSRRRRRQGRIHNMGKNCIEGKVPYIGKAPKKRKCWRPPRKEKEKNECFDE